MIQDRQGGCAVSLPASAARVQELLKQSGSQAKVVEFPTGTRTVAEAAASIGVDVRQIAKSLLFMAGEAPILVIACGPNRVDTKRLRQLVGAAVRQATPEEVKTITGFPIGGVAPLGHECRLRVLLDERLWDHPVVYAAAGTPTTAFATSGNELLAITGGERVDVAINSEKRS